MNRRSLAVALFFSVLAAVAFTSPHTLTLAVVAPWIWAVLVLSVVWSASRLALFLCPGAIPVQRIVAGAVLFEIISSLTISLLIFFSALSLGSQILVVAAVTLLAMHLSPPSVDYLPVAKVMGFAVKQLDALAVGGLAIACFAWLIASRHQVLFIVQDADNMIYHLPMMAEWIRTGSSWQTEVAYSNPRVFWPGFRESVLAFLSLPMRNEHLAILGVLELPLFAMLTYGLTRFYGVSRTVAVVTASYAGTTPMVVNAAMLQGNDLSLAINLCASVFFLLLYIDKPGAGYAILSGLALGTLASTKYSGVIYAGLVTVSAFFAVLAKGGSAWKKVICTRNSILILAGLILVAAPWYMRNIIGFANPFYPGQIKIGETVLFEGPWVLGRDHTSVGWDIRPLISVWRHWLNAFGILVPVILMNSVVGSILWFSNKALRRELLMLIVLPTALLIAFLYHPDNFPELDWAFNMRYLLPWYTVSLVALIVLLGRYRQFKAWQTVLLLAASLVNVAGWTGWWPLVTAFSLAGMFIWSAFKTSKRIHFSGFQSLGKIQIVLGFSLLAFLAFSLNFVRARQQYDPDYGYHDVTGDQGWGPIVAYSHQHIHSKKIVVCGRNSIFPLYGEPFSNQIFLVENSVSAKDLIALADAKTADYIVSFVPKSSRQENEFQYGDGIGPALLREFPDRVSVQVESQGSYLLRINKPKNKISRAVLSGVLPLSE